MRSRMITSMAGKSTVNSINMRIDALKKGGKGGGAHPGVLSIGALRIAVLAVFFLSVAVTALSLLFRHNHLLHIAHLTTATLTFLLIALYLIESADIASLRLSRELRLRGTVDAGYEFAGYIRAGSPLYNMCAGVLAKNGVYPGGAAAMSALAKCRTVAAAGNSASRQGYAVTKATLEKMGLTLSDNLDDCPVKIVLGPFDPVESPAADFTLTRDRITHLLTAVYISRIYVKYVRLTRILLFIALTAAAALLVLGQIPYAGAAIALWPAAEIMILRHIERTTARLSFQSVLSC